MQHLVPSPDLGMAPGTDAAPASRMVPPPGGAAAAQLSRVRVRCVSRTGDDEETLLVPVAGASSWTVASLLQRVRERVRHVPKEDLQELELDGSGGRLHLDDHLEEVLKDGDLLVCTVSRTSRPVRLVPAAGSGGHAYGDARAGGYGRLHLWPAPRPQGNNGNADLEAGYARVFGSEAGPGHDDGGDEDEEESDESPTPPAPGMYGVAVGSRPSPRSTYGLARGPGYVIPGIWRTRQQQALGGAVAGATTPAPPAPPAPPASPTVPAALGRGRSRSPMARRTHCEMAPPTTTWSAIEKDGRESKWPPLLRAVYDGDLETAEELLRQGADVNCTMPGAGQKTPIYYAVRFEVPELVRLLLNHPDVDVHREMRLGRGGSWTTPLEAAREAGPTSGVYQAFVEHGLLEGKAVEAAPPRAAPPRRTSPYAGLPLATRRAMYGKSWDGDGAEDAEAGPGSSLASSW